MSKRDRRYKGAARRAAEELHKETNKLAKRILKKDNPKKRRSVK